MRVTKKKLKEEYGALSGGVQKANEKTVTPKKVTTGVSKASTPSSATPKPKKAATPSGGRKRAAPGKKSGAEMEEVTTDGDGAGDGCRGLGLLRRG